VEVGGRGETTKANHRGARMTHEDFVKNILTSVDDRGRLKSRERNDLEYKQSFHKKNFAKYAKTMAAFANNKGGYILFGIGDSPRDVIGISEQFDEIKQQDITASLNSLFAPEILWDTGTVENSGRKIGFIYTYESSNKPIVAQKIENSERINSGDIYYRYRGCTERIKYSELRRIIDDNVNTEREKLLRHFEAILKSGTTNIGIVNYDNGLFSTPDGVNIAVDRKLMAQVLKKAKFIKEGSFNETTGQPVLKVTGNISLAEEIPVPDIDPDIQYPYIQKQLAEKLQISSTDVYALVWKYKLKGIKKFHLVVTNSSSHSQIHKFSDIALQFLAEKINENKENPSFISDIRAEYKNRQ
jgi:hypothetical protein